MQKRTGLLSVLLILSFFTGFAQTNTAIKGFVYDKGSGEPMPSTLVILKGTNVGVQTDVNGYFSMQVPPGPYTLMTVLLGYDTASVSGKIDAGQVLSHKLFISPRATSLGDVEISAAAKDKTTKVNIGTTTVTPREMKLLPSAGGEPDIAQYLQVIPGVVFTGDQGGQLYIRGGNTTQTGILLDGVTIYNPFHSIGLYSVFETDAIRNVDVMTGGFGAQYGNRTSAIIDVHTKDGNKNRLAGKLSASPIMVRGMLEGPLMKPKSEGASSLSFLVSAKHSYLSSTSKSIYGSFGEPFKSGLPYQFTDLYAKVTLNADNGSKLNVFGFDFDDKASILNAQTHNDDADYHWNAAGGGATFVVTPGNSSALIDGKFAYSKYNVDFNQISTGTPRKTSIDGFEGGINFSYFLPHYSLLKYGIEVSGYHTTLDYTNDFKQNTTQDRQSTLAAIFVEYRRNFGDKFVLDPSIRVQYYSSINKVSPEPRLGLKYNITENVRLKAAAGLYSQNILSSKSDRDIVNFFSGYLLSPDESIRNTEGKVVASNLQTAYHLLGGLEVDVNRVEFNVEPWYKNFTRNIELSRIKAFSSDPNFLAGYGKAYGIDLSMKYSYNRIFLWTVFSYQKVEYTTLIPDSIPYNFYNSTNVEDRYHKQSYPPPFDRRFNMNILAAYTAGKKNDWDFSARYNLGSPFPFTQTQAFYENINAGANGVNTNYAQANGVIGILYGQQLNGGRLSWYHRLDISIKKRFKLSKYSNLETTFSVTNVYDRDNIFYVDRVTNVKVYQLPVFPSLNLTWNF
ncbi:MAG: hypothetical protein BGO69_08095 [Bacteroidetes bacterium 46-16]|nr:MAG: hypothetical protein BGO69_08095 [Bacteroidetes bacterium 46-16]